LASLPEYNKLKYQTTILQRSKTIYSLFQMEIFRTYIVKLYYDYLTKVIKNVPFVRAMIVAAMS